MKTLRSSFWPLALSSVGAALLFVFVYKRVKSKPNTVKDKDDEAPPGGHSTDLHGRPWRNMKKSEKAEWHAKHGETDKDTARIEATSKEIIFPKVDGVEMPITEKSLPHWITLVMTTSPVTSNPSTDLINEVANSLKFIPNSILNCPKLIICDGYKFRDKNKFRSGEITSEWVDAYIEYKKNLQVLTENKESIFSGAKLLELEERNGFGYAMREGMAHITTPYVIVVQHDRNFTRGFDLLKVVKGMRRHYHWCHYVGLPTSRTIKHASLILSKYRVRVSTVHADVGDREACAPRVASEDKVHLKALLGTTLSQPKTNQNEYESKSSDAEPSDGWWDSSDRENCMDLVPLIQWYDSTHIASTSYYRNFVFERRAKRVAKGGFIEDKLGQQQLKVILERGMEAHVPYGTFILDDHIDKPTVSHLDGHDPRNAARFVFVEG